MEQAEKTQGIVQLIADRKGDRSYARLSRDCGGRPGPNRLQAMATMPLVSFPGADIIQGLALGLNASVTEIVLACATSIGLDVNRGPSPHGLVLHGAATLPIDAQEALIETSRQMQKLQAGAGA